MMPRNIVRLTATPLTSLAWAAVVTTALAVSNWSLYFTGRHFGLPVPLAIVLSIVFDGAALVAGDLSLRYAREGSNGASPRAAVFALAGLSAWLNSYHATILHAPVQAHVMYAVPPVVAVGLFEMHHRFERRAALCESGRTTEPLPVFGVMAWTLHTWKAVKAVSEITGKIVSGRTVAMMARLDSDIKIAKAGETSRILSETRQNFNGTAGREAITAWAKGKGIVIGERGPVPQNIRDQYMREITGVSEHAN